MSGKQIVSRTLVTFVFGISAVVGISHVVQRSELQKRVATLSNRVTQRQEHVASVQSALSTQRATLDEFNASVRGYMVDHKGIVAGLLAMGTGGGIALDDKNGFSEDAKELAAAAGGVGLLYCVANGSECAKVLSELDKADAHRKALESELASTQAAIGRESSLIVNDQNSLEAARRDLGN